MEFISLIIYIICTLTITSSAPIGYYTSKQFGKQDVPAKQNIFVSCENLADLIESSTGNVRFQNDITQPPHVNQYQTERKQPVVAVVDTSIKVGKSSDRPLQWTLPDYQRWLPTRLPYKGTSGSSVVSISQSTMTQPTVRRRSTTLSSLPPTTGHYDEVTELPTTTKQSSVYTSQSIAISRMISTPGVIHQNKDYIAISMFDDHGHIVRRLVERILIDAATATTQENKKL